MGIDQPDEDGARPDNADPPDASEARGASASAASGDGGRVRAVPAASAGEHEAYRASVDAVFRAHAIDQAYDRLAAGHLQVEDQRKAVDVGVSGQRRQLLALYWPPLSADSASRA